MNVDNLMMLMIWGGIALCGAYFRGQYRDWCNHRVDTATAEAVKRRCLANPCL